MADAGESSTSGADVLAAQGLEEISDADLGFEEEGDTDSDDTDSNDDSNDESKDDDDSKDADDDDSKDDGDDDSDDDDDSGDDGSADDDSDDDDSGDDDSASEDDTAASKSKAKQSPPKGFVPIKALREARSTNSFLKGQMSGLQEQIDSLTNRTDSKKEDDHDIETFEEMSEKEYTDLVEDDPAKALLYMQKLNKFQHSQYAKERQSDALSAAKANEKRIMTAATEQMAEIAPGLFDEDSAVHDELVTFADTIGFSDDMFYLTNPATQVILPGETEPLFLGDQAASMLQMLVTAKGKLASTVDKLGDKAHKKLESKIRASVEKELLEKFKTDKDATFKSLQQISKAKDTKEFGESVLTDKQFTKLSEKDQERYLSGG